MRYFACGLSLPELEKYFLLLRDACPDVWEADEAQTHYGWDLAWKVESLQRWFLIFSKINSSSTPHWPYMAVFHRQVPSTRFACSPKWFHINENIKREILFIIFLLFSPFLVSIKIWICKDRLRNEWKAMSKKWKTPNERNLRILLFGRF